MISVWESAVKLPWPSNQRAQLPEHLKSQPRGLNQGLSLHLKETIEDHLEMELSEQLNLFLRLGSQGEVGATEPRGHWRKKKNA